MSDFTDIVDIHGVFFKTELDLGVDFVPSGDAGVLVVSGKTGFGEGGFGEGPFGGIVSYTLSNPITPWRNITTP